MSGFGTKYWIEMLSDRCRTGYFPGEIIEGYLFIQSASPVPLSGLYLLLTGKATVLLRKFEGKKVTNLFQHESYITKREDVKDLKSCTDPPRVLPNTSVLEFQFFLPPGLPPSFTSPLGNKGHVEYRLELNKSMGTSEKTLYKCVILVAPFLSLAGNVAATLPVSQEQHHARHFCCGADRNITVQASITQAGILAGERIPFRAVITNHSDSYIKSSHVTLRHRWIWYSIGQTHTSSRTVWSFKQVSRGAIPPGGSMTWGENDEPLVLPSDLIPTGPPGCSIMMVSYELCLTVIPKGMVKDMKLLLPIIVGSAMPPEVQATVERNTASYSALLRGAILYTC
ncbi:uncharacterized protein LOC112557830 isoform X2 [Pomacea canaliculata]|nr:uncharacterized protein LOC112557830 isoform X2 [Pomacea canaliculata]XP_025083682.1 uncharacterized protein LOC112557830 isoform X2 [Pomacea canaliculata]